ncbi:Ig-like domain-containing protein, partial [Intestinimonas massiliensis]|uniref:Ig-like domain-containing protein n=1 Tax=Intestinimonas massiliensis (ex Afouda et al. 2020) TaxID=1673721 RepID=UPI0021089D3A
AMLSAAQWPSTSAKVGAVATVEDGLVRAVAEGTAVITVTSADGGFTAQCSVRVRTRHASSKDSGSSGSGSGSAGDSAATPEVPAEPTQPVVPDEPAAPEATA